MYFYAADSIPQLFLHKSSLKYAHYDIAKQD